MTEGVAAARVVAVGVVRACSHVEEAEGESSVGQAAVWAVIIESGWG
jgi:hypothetical protein